MFLSERGAALGCDRPSVRRAVETLRDQRPAAPLGAELSRSHIFRLPPGPGCLVTPHGLSELSAVTQDGRTFQGHLVHPLFFTEGRLRPHREEACLPTATQHTQKGEHPALVCAA